MNKKELVCKAAAKSGLSQRDVTALLNALLEITEDELAAGGSVMISGFGSLEAKTKSARKGVHPRTGEAIEIPPVHTAVFHPGSRLQAKLDASSEPTDTDA